MQAIRIAAILLGFFYLSSCTNRTTSPVDSRKFNIENFSSNELIKILTTFSKKNALTVTCSNSIFPEDRELLACSLKKNNTSIIDFLKRIETKEFYLILYQPDELSHKLFNELANEIKYKTQKDTATAP